MSFETITPGPVGLAAASSNKVLRNTYFLLALSLVPTVAGALVGVSTGFNIFAYGSLIGILLFFGIAYGFIFAIERNKNSSLGVGLLLGFTFFMGLMMTGLLSWILKKNGGGNLIAMAFGGTSIIFFCMATLASTIKRDLSGMGKFLFVGAVVILLAGVANVFLQISVLQLVIIVAAIIIFSAFMLYDVNRVITGGETNYVTATLAIYLDIYNVFNNLLALLGITSSND